MGYTAWNYFTGLVEADAETYLKTRAGQKFNVIQAVALAEPDGVPTGNHYGRRPLKRNKDSNGGMDRNRPFRQSGNGYIYGTIQWARARLGAFPKKRAKA